MARFYGKVGFVMTRETRSGIWEEVEVPRDYYGDVLNNRYKWSSRDELNDDADISNEISIVADQFAYDNLLAIKWVEWMGAKWKVSLASIDFPRIRLSIGGVYNG